MYYWGKLWCWKQLRLVIRRGTMRVCMPLGTLVWALNFCIQLCTWSYNQSWLRIITKFLVSLLFRHFSSKLESGISFLAGPNVLIVHLKSNFMLFEPIWLQLDWTSNTSQQKINSRKNVRATTIPRPPLENSQRGESRSAWSIFVKFIFTSFFKTTFQIMPKQK